MENNEIPWAMAKIAFNYNFDAKLANLIFDYIDDNKEILDIPQNWKISELDGSCAGDYFFIFNVNGPITKEDGIRVKNIIESVAFTIKNKRNIKKQKLSPF